MAGKARDKHEMIAPNLTAPPIQAVSEPVALRLYAAAATLIALGVYLLTLAPDLTWANAATDGGELITAAATLGIPHPPGYPLYVVLGKLFSMLPLGTVALRFNLLSAVCGALAVGVLVLAIGTFHGSRVRPPFAAATALLFGFAPLVWSQATVAEVYTLNLLLLAVFLLAWSRAGASGWSGLWLGLAITTHLTSLLMLPALLVGRGRGRALAGLAAGLTPLLLLPLLARSDSPVVWGQPADLAGWWWLVSGRLYAANLQAALDGERVLALLQALALGPVALVVAGRTLDKPLARLTAVTGERHATLILWAIPLAYGAFGLLYATADAAVMLLPGLMVAALLLAPRLAALGRASLVLPMLLVILGYPTQNLSGSEPRALAGAVFAAAPADAILLAPGDQTIFTLWYFHHVEGWRPDLILVDSNLFAFDWYRERLARQYPSIIVPEADDLTAFQRLNAPRRPFCSVSLGAPASPRAATALEGQALAGSFGLNCVEGVN